jgi:flagellar assembly factor FliW
MSTYQKQEEPMSVATLEPSRTTDLPVIDFVAPMPGFPDDKQFVLVQVEDSEVIFELTSKDHPDLRFVVVPPVALFPEYSPEIDDETLKTLGVSDPKNVVMLLVVTTGDSIASTTVNTAAPIVIDQASKKGVQLVLNRADLSVREPLNPAK